MEFNEAQLSEIRLAESQGVRDSEIKRHPDWSSLIMNTCWNREKEGKDITTVYHTAEWFNATGDPKLADDLDFVMKVLCIYDIGGTPSKPMYNSDGTVNRAMTLYNLTHKFYILNGSLVLKSDRISINDITEWDLPIIMGEGYDSVINIIKQLKKMTPVKHEHHDNIFSHMADMSFQRGAVLLDLDNMNIRGKQILYAVDYVDKDISKLITLLRNRDENLVDYINMRTAKSNRDGCAEDYQLAVTSGASFMKNGGISFAVNDRVLNMTPGEFAKYAGMNIKELKVDYSALDIVDGVTTDMAIKILESRGFRVIKEFQHNPKFPDAGVVYKYMLFYKDSTKDYIVADCTSPDDFVYGGVEMYCHRVVPPYERMTLFDLHCSTGGHKNQKGCYMQFTHHDGLFKCSDRVLGYQPDEDFDWSKIGFSTYGIPIPQYFEEPFIYQNDLYNICKKYSYLFKDMSIYHIVNVVNAILLYYDTDFLEHSNEHYLLYRDWFITNCVSDVASCWSGDDEEALTCLSVALTYLKVPKDFVDKIIKGAYIAFEEVDKDPDKTCNNCVKNFEKYSKDITSNFKEVIPLFDKLGFPKVETLPVKLPWIS